MKMPEPIKSVLAPAPAPPKMEPVKTAPVPVKATEPVKISEPVKPVELKKPAPEPVKEIKKEEPKKSTIIETKPKTEVITAEAIFCKMGLGKLAIVNLLSSTN